jgi:hypothetical protein
MTEMSEFFEKAMSQGFSDYRSAIRARYDLEARTGHIWQANPRGGRYYLSVHTYGQNRERRSE